MPVKKRTSAAPQPELLGNLPHNPEAERVVLAGLLMEPEQADEVAGILEAEDFYNPAHRLIYATIQTLRRIKKGHFDAALVGERLEASGKLVDVGGYEYLVELAERTIPHAGLTVTHAERIIESSMKRAAEFAATDLARGCRAPDADIEALIGEVDTKLHAILERKAGGAQGVVDLTRVFLDVMDRINTGRTMGAATGWSALDDLLCGLHPGNLYVVAGRPGTGKTAFGVKLALNFAGRNIPSLFVSLEQPLIDLAERMMSLRSGIGVEVMRKPNLGDESRNALLKAAGQMTDFPLHIDDNAEQTVQRLSSVARLWKRRHDIHLIVVDYLQLITPADRRINREQQVAEISRSLKLLAKSLNLPVVVLAQLNRAVESRTVKRPILADLRESGAIEQDADAVLFLFRPWLHDPDDLNLNPTMATLIVAKNRNGRTGDVDLFFKPDTMDYRDPEPPQVQEWVQ